MAEDSDDGDGVAKVGMEDIESEDRRDVASPQVDAEEEEQAAKRSERLDEEDSLEEEEEDDSVRQSFFGYFI